MTHIERAERAKELLENPAMRAVFREIRENLVAKLEAAPMGAVDDHHEIALTLQCLKSIQTMLERYTQEIEVDKHKQQQQSFMDRIRERLTP
jgi:hypothetical protein